MRDNSIDTRHIDVLDGVRAIAVMIVAWYHIWQQSWLMPVLRTPFLSFIGINSINFDVLPRTGYIFVDLLLLLSSFLLFLPYARAASSGAPLPGAAEFYKRRFTRIVPSYYLAVLVIFFGYAVPAHSFDTFRQAAVELFSNLTFSQVFFRSPYLFSKINGVLWTVCIEMQFYLLFPLLARAFVKKPLVTYLCMLAASAVYIRVLILPHPDAVRMGLNQLPAFFGVFANGMMASLLFVRLAARVQRGPWLAAAGTLSSLVFAVLIWRILRGAAAAESVQVYQLQARFVFSCALTAFVFSTALAAKWFRLLFSNAVMRFFAAISYNLYIWHQWLAVRFKAWRIPYWTGDTAPNFTGDLPWQKTYTLICFIAAIAVAAFITYLFERPAAKALTRWFAGRGEEKTA